MNDRLLVGAGKGLLVFERRGESWRHAGVHFLGMPVSAAWADPRDGAWWAALAHRHWGQKLHRSDDEGASWSPVAPPAYPQGATLKDGRPATLRKIWAIQHGGEDRPGRLYLGTEPGGLFRSDDGGRNWRLEEALWRHPSRQIGWFGAGRDHPFIHSIVVDPRDSEHLYVGVSCAGIFETRDGGAHWTARNQGLIATYLPNPRAEIGHDPHLVLACRAQPEVLWQQNHCGIFRSVNGGASWDNVSGKEGFPEYGFALAIDDDDPERAWVIPAISDEVRVAHNLALCVCRTDDGGRSWRALRRGLPQEYCFDIVFRHAFAAKGPRLAFGTTQGNLFLSEDGGDNWMRIAAFLPRVDSVCFA
jgi:photosystem II stability/assembly factor-like uncharacterized protein